MEKNMEVVSTVLTNLKNMAIDMETELGVHNEQVKLINNMVREILLVSKKSIICKG
jgi:hypothetical protein